MKKRVHRILGLAGIFLLLCMSLPARVGSTDERIAVLVSAGDAPFKEAVAGFNEFLEKQGRVSSYDVIQLDGNPAKAGPAIERIRSGGTRLIFTVGTLATDAAMKEAGDVPIVACLVLRAELLKHADNATGVGLEFPVETQITWMQKMLPRARTIGVLYSPSENQARVNEAAETAKRTGRRLVAEAVRSPQDIPAALNNLARRADALWVIPDGIVLSPLIAKNILLFSFRNNIPVIGPSTPWVKAGALYALDWDYADLGAQCGELANRIIEGTAVSALAPGSPRKVRYAVNMTTARQMKVRLDDSIVRGARETY
jgi:putative ABC transport system substrate-binding protein